MTMQIPGRTEFYTKVISSLVFPLQERLKRHTTVAVRDALELSQWWSPQQIAQLQLVRLKALLSDASKDVPYYRDLFQRIGFDPREVKTLADLGRLPLLSKSEIRAQPEAFKSNRAIGLARSNTGGSSGEPLVFYIGTERVSHDVAAKWRATRWWGVDIGDREIVVWGSPIELGVQDRMRAMRDRVMRTRLLPAFEMSELKLAGFVDEIRAVRPKMLFGYPSALAHIARYAANHQVRLDTLGIRVAFTTSERLYDDQRDSIESVFGCRVANGYGGRDAGFIAHECPSGGMHITAEDIIVEIVDPRGDPVAVGEPGEIVVTHLATRDFPFVRYRTGDVGVLRPDGCACGRGLPMLDKIQGRTTDFVITMDNTVMHGLALIYVIRDLPEIESFKIVQESTQLTRVLIVPSPRFEQRIADAIVEGFKRRLGRDVDVRIERVAVIPAEPSGKRRYVVSHARRPDTVQREEAPFVESQPAKVSSNA